MAGDWIKARVVLHEEDEVLAIAADLGMDRFAVIGRLLRIWGWFDQHTNTGSARSATDALLDELVAQKGFTNAMRKSKWIEDISGGGLRVPKWNRHNGTTGKKRANGQKRQQRFRNARASRSASLEKRREEKRLHTPHSPPRGGGPEGAAARSERRKTRREVQQEEFSRALDEEVARLEAEGK